MAWIVKYISHPQPCACLPGTSGSWLAGHSPWVLVWAGACYWHGVGGFVFNSPSSWIAKYGTARPFSKCCDNHHTPAHNHAPSHAPTHRHEHTELLAILTAHGAFQHGTGARGHTRPPPPGAHPSLATAAVEPLVGAVGSPAALQRCLAAWRCGRGERANASGALCHGGGSRREPRATRHGRLSRVVRKRRAHLRCA